MSIEETLLKQRQAAEEKKQREEEEAKEAERIRLESEEMERGKAVHAQIDNLKSQKTALEENFKNLKDSFAESGEALGDFAKESKKLGDIHKKFEADLRERGIEDKADLVQSPDFAEDEDVQKYKEKGKVLRKEVGVLSRSKKEIKKAIPDLDFRGGKSESKKKSPRETSSEKIANQIAEIEKQIADLERDTPERRAEEKRVADCAMEISNKVPFLGVGAGFDRLSKVNTFGSYGPERIRPEYFIAKYGESAFEEALLKGFEGEIDRFTKEYKATAEKRYGAMSEEGIQSKVEKILKARIHMDVVESKLQNLIDQKHAKSIFEKGEQIFFDKQAAESWLPEVAEKRRLAKQDMLIKTRSPYKGSGRFGDTGFEVLSKNYESNETRQIARQIEELNLGKAQAHAMLDEKTTNRPMLFGKKEHAAEEQKLKDKLGEINKKLRKLEQDLERQKERDSMCEEKITELSLFVRNSGLAGEKSLISQGTTVKEFLDEIERILKENSQKKLTPEEAEVRQKYYDMRGELTKAQQVLEDAVHY